jgi:sulfoxide reductase heme-binding subunit YedZ
MGRYFVNTSGTLDAGTKAFITANWFGLAAALLLVVLLSISNDIALRTLGTRRWKLIQQSTYVVAITVVIHGGIYQILEKRKWLLALVFALLAVISLMFQSLGMRVRRRRLKAREANNVSARP